MDERGTATVLLVIAVMCQMIFLAALLALNMMSIERIRQQTEADLAALAGGNVLAKSIETARAIDGVVWARNMTLDAMYLAASIATIGSAGAGAEAFSIPLEFQRVTIKPVEALENTKRVIGKAAVPYSIVNSASIIKANNPNDYGGAIPYPPGIDRDIGQRRKDLMQMIGTYDSRIGQAKKEMDAVIKSLEERKYRLRESGVGLDYIERDSQVVRLTAEVREKCGRVGGLTTQRNRRQQELAKVKSRKPLAFNAHSVVAVVYHPSTIIPSTSIFGGIETGDNIIVSAAVITDGPSDMRIGEKELDTLLSIAPGGTYTAKGVDKILDSVNLCGEKARTTSASYGPVGAYIFRVLKRLDLVPPPLNKTRPTLAPVESVVGTGDMDMESILDAIVKRR